MEPSTAGEVLSKPPPTEPTKKTHGDLNFEQLTVPGLGSGPILPEWLSKLFRRNKTPAAH
jgi:hypothetical protein